MLFVEGFSLFDVFYLADPIDIANTIRQVVGLISIERSIDRKALVDALLAREEIMYGHRQWGRDSPCSAVRQREPCGSSGRHCDGGIPF